MNWWDWMPWSSFFKCWVLSQLFHSFLSPSLNGSLVHLHFLPLEWYHLHIWGGWYFSCESWVQIAIHPTWHFMWCRRPGFDPWVRKIRWRREWQPTPVFLPGESHGRRTPGRLPSMEWQRVRHSWVTSLSLFFWSFSAELLRQVERLKFQNKYLRLKKIFHFSLMLFQMKIIETWFTVLQVNEYTLICQIQGTHKTPGDVRVADGTLQEPEPQTACWQDALQFSPPGLYSGSLHSPSEAKLFPQAKNSFWWLSNLCRQQENDRWTGPFCSKLKMPTKNMIVIAGVRCGPGGPTTVSSKGGGL